VLVTKWQIPSCSDGEVEAVTMFSSLSVDEPVKPTKSDQAEPVKPTKSDQAESVKPTKSDQAAATVSKPIVEDQSPVNQDQLSVEEIETSLKLGNASSSQQDHTLIKPNQESNQIMTNATYTSDHPPQSLQRPNQLLRDGLCDPTVISPAVSCANILGTPVDRYTPPTLLTNNGKI